jgi:methylenetetrahydrofolate dehydrogenase (NADP+)/methenyltetrahydrofolate cyclohydrolase
MTASIIDGKHVASEIRNKIKQIVSEQTSRGHRAPGLAVVIVGDDSASHVYVNNKRKACTEVGFNSYAYDLPTTTSEKKLLELIDTLNESGDVDGILVQLPLPAHINAATIIERIKPSKDVDGFNPYNLGRLAQGNPLLRPCTPYGVMQLFEYYQLALPGKHAVVVGASNIVGRPMALELLMAKATVTICHRATKQLERHIRIADVVVVATGVYNVVNPEWLHAEQIVIDVGMHRSQDGTLHGDMNFDEAKKRVKWITPVPGGIGPMTICTLLQNTLLAAGIHQ